MSFCTLVQVLSTGSCTPSDSFWFWCTQCSRCHFALCGEHGPRSYIQQAVPQTSRFFRKHSVLGVIFSLHCVVSMVLSPQFRNIARAVQREAGSSSDRWYHFRPEITAKSFEAYLWGKSDWSWSKSIIIDGHHYLWWHDWRDALVRPWLCGTCKMMAWERPNKSKLSYSARQLKWTEQRQSRQSDLSSDNEGKAIWRPPQLLQ